MSLPSFDKSTPLPIMVRMSGALAVLFSASALASVSPPPWYAQKACLFAHREVLSLDVNRAQVAIEQMKARRNIDEKACGYWLEVPRSTAELVLRGKRHVRPEDREKRLKVLNAFARRFAKARPHFRDLAIEARMHRVRLLLETGDKTEALKEARRVQKMLDSMAGRPETASRAYVRGAIDLIVGEAAWPVKTLLSMAGVKGNGDRGRKALEALARENTVYKAEALSVLYHFARQNDGAKHPTTKRYGAALAAAYPENPQFAFDHGRDLLEAGGTDAAFGVIEPAYQKILKDDRSWTARVRKRVLWLTAQTAFDIKKPTIARDACGRAQEQANGAYEAELAVLSRALRP